MLLGLWAVLLLLTLPTTAVGVAQAAVGATAATILALRGGGATDAFTRMPRNLAKFAARIGERMGGAATLVGSALAADIKLCPGLVRIHVDGGADVAEAVAVIGTTPGQFVISFDNDSVLAHALNEDSIDVARARADVAKEDDR
jgi:multisubunit Na+/H+ antiporter MnhE subunit